MERETMTVEEAARVLGISRGSAYEAARQGKLPAIRIGRRLLVPRVALNRLLEHGDAQTADATGGDSKAQAGIRLIGS